MEQVLWDDVSSCSSSLFYERRHLNSGFTLPFSDMFNFFFLCGVNMTFL